MTDVENIAVSFKSEVVADWIQSIMTEEHGDEPLDAYRKHLLLTKYARRMLDAFEEHMWMCIHPEAQAADPGEYVDMYSLFEELEQEMAVTYPNHYALLFIPMDLNGMILAILTHYPERQSTS